MEIAITWMPIVLAALLILGSAALAFVIIARRRRARSVALPVAHSERLAALPGYRRLLLRYRILLGGLLALVMLGTGSAGLLASRPVDSVVENADRFNRDIVLCLDVSGSMVDYDAKILRQFEQLAERFAGERISLVVWNNSAVQLFPLTDDYDYLASQLALVRQSMEADYDSDQAYNYWNGTDIAEGASLIGDGLASCVLRFDQLDSERSRSIVLATDNLINGTSLVTLEQAGELAEDRGVRVYGVNPADVAAPMEGDQFEAVVLATGGGYFQLEGNGTVDTIVDSVLSEQATHLKGAPELVFYDVPAVPLAVLVLSFAALLVLSWRVRR